MISFRHNRRKFMAACASLVAACFIPRLQIRRNLRSVFCKTIEEIKPGMMVYYGVDKCWFTVIKGAASPCKWNGEWFENYRRDKFWVRKSVLSKKVLVCFCDAESAQHNGYILFYA